MQIVFKVTFSRAYPEQHLKQTFDFISNFEHIFACWESAYYHVENSTT